MSWLRTIASFQDRTFLIRWRSVKGCFNVLFLSSDSSMVIKRFFFLLKNKSKWKRRWKQTQFSYSGCWEDEEEKPGGFVSKRESEYFWLGLIWNKQRQIEIFSWNCINKIIFYYFNIMKVTGRCATTSVENTYNKSKFILVFLHTIIKIITHFSQFFHLRKAV